MLINEQLCACTYVTLSGNRIGNVLCYLHMLDFLLVHLSSALQRLPFVLVCPFQIHLCAFVSLLKPHSGLDSLLLPLLVLVL